MKRTLMAMAIMLALFGCDGAGSATNDDATPEEESKKFGKADGPDDSPVLVDGAIDWEQVAKRCGVPAEDEAIVYADDFEWGVSLEEMGQRFDEMYASGKRLTGRAYYEEDSGEFIFPLSETWGGRATLSRRLVENVRMHIEKALTRGYADYVFFPDMGHSHFFIPQDIYDEIYAPYPVPHRGAMYSALFEEPELKVLYHTAEQLQMLDEDDALLPDRQVQWRFFTRNVVGDNDWAGRIDLLHEPTTKANTGRDLEGHYYFGAGFNVTATAGGCFPYVHDGQVFFFDLSMEDLPYEVIDTDSWY